MVITRAYSRSRFPCSIRQFHTARQVFVLLFVCWPCIGGGCREILFGSHMDMKRERAFSSFFGCVQYCGNFTRKGIALNCSTELWDQWQLRNNSLDSFDFSWLTEVAAKFLYLHLIIIIVAFCFGPQERHILVKDKNRVCIYTRYPGIYRVLVCKNRVSFFRFSSVSLSAVISASKVW